MTRRPSTWRTWPGSNGSMRPCCSAIRRIHLSLLMLMGSIVGGACGGARGSLGQVHPLDHAVVAEHDQREQQFVEIAGVRHLAREQGRRVRVEHQEVGLAAGL